tara:strand:- start:1105 stop:1722 length:618 start_codon:yes stop_codon:yes gene_type:complete
MVVIGIDNKKQRGLTLLEALISTVIVGIGFIAVFQMVTYSVQSIDVSGERTKTNYLVSMIAEDLIGDKSSKKGADKLYEHLANKTDTGKFAWQNDDCKIKSGNPYKGTDIAIDNKFEKWDFRLSKDRVKCRPKAKGSTKTNDIKLLKVYEICKRGVKEDGKTRANCDYRNEYVWDKTYIGRMEVKMPTSGGKNKFKSKYLYFQMN